MKLEKLEIRNYRSLFVDRDNGDEFVLDLADGVNVITGPNNTGKSNIFRALAFALDPDFKYNRSLDTPMTGVWSKPSVTLTFRVPSKAVPSREKTLLKYLREYEHKVKGSSSGKTYADESFVKLRVTIEGAEDSAGERRQVFVARGAGARSLPDDDPVAERAIEQFRKCLHFVMIRSGESLETLLEGKFRDLLRTVLYDEMRDVYRTAEESRQRFSDELCSGLLASLSGRISSELNELFPEINQVRLEPRVLSLDETLSGMRIDVTDVASTDLSDKGTGVRGGLIIAMLRYLTYAGKRSMVFAVEEPESFLHPAAQEQLREDLEALAERLDVSLLVTTHSPYIVSRRSDAMVFAVAKDITGRTALRAQAPGNEPQAGALGGLFRDSLLAEFLDRVESIPVPATLALIVEGTTDREYIELAGERAERMDLLDGVSIIEAGFGQRGANPGGASLAVMQALVSRSLYTVPTIVLLDNDEEGRKSESMLRSIGSSTGDWKPDKTLFNYRCVFNPSNKGFAYEAEDLWPDHLVEGFVAANEDERLAGKIKRPKPEGGWHFDLTPKVKGSFVQHLRIHARAVDCERWIHLLELIRKAHPA